MGRLLEQSGEGRTLVQSAFKTLESGLWPRIAMVSRQDDETPEQATISYIGVSSILAVSVPLSVVDPNFLRELDKSE